MEQSCNRSPPDHKDLNVRVLFEQFCKGCVLEAAVGGAVDLYCIIYSMFLYHHYEEWSPKNSATGFSEYLVWILRNTFGMRWMEGVTIHIL